jgi:hypothetical protein
MRYTSPSAIALGISAGKGFSDSLDEGDGDGLQPVRLNVEVNRIQPRRILLRTEKQCPQGLKSLRENRSELSPDRDV